MSTNLTKIAAVLVFGLSVAACGVTKSNFTSDWCISTDGLTLEERAWAERVCDGNDVNRSVDVRSDDDVVTEPGEDAPGNSDGKGKGKKKGHDK